MLPDLVASFQAAVVDVLVTKAIQAAQHHHTPIIALCGGVACNSLLRAQLTQAAERHRLRIVLAPPKFCTDNAAMIAGLAYHDCRHGRTDSLDMPANARLNHALGVIPFAPNAK